jgi:hypothetical protein
MAGFSQYLSGFPASWENGSIPFATMIKKI